MKQETLQEKSTEDLLKRKKTAQFATGLLIGVLTMLVIMATLLGYKKGFNEAIHFYIVALSLSPIVIITLNDVKATQKELQARKSVL